jgi:hypothetical protein
VARCPRDLARDPARVGPDAVAVGARLQPADPADSRLSRVGAGVGARRGGERERRQHGGRQDRREHTQVQAGRRRPAPTTGRRQELFFGR